MGLTRRSLFTAGAASAAALAVGAPLAQAASDMPRRTPVGSGHPASPGRGWQSRLLRVGPGGELSYPHDDDGHRLPDFSHAGYHNGDRPLPDVATDLTIAPIAGDNTAHIQAAIDAVGQRPLGPDGFRGAIQLEAGRYDVAGTIRINRDGVVLRGVGDGADPATNTVLRAVGVDPPRREVIVVGGGGSTGWDGEVDGTRTDLVTDLVEVADDSFEVANASALEVGDNVIVVHPCTAEWLDAIDGGGTDVDDPWEVDSHPIVYNRYIRAIDGNTVRLDVPVFNRLDRSLSPSYLYRWDRAGLVREVGVESLRIDIEYQGEPDEDGEHARIAVQLRQVEDAWVRDCTMLHFLHAGVETWEATRATVANCRALEPVSEITGGVRYNYNAYHNSQQILFVDCVASWARHAFISNGTSTVSGVVFLRGVSEHSLNASEGHRRWSQGMLFDNHVEVDPETSITLGLYNRGSYGTGHGWSVAHAVAWNCDVADTRLIVQQPPTAQNYAIGCFGTVTGDGPFEQPAGYIEGANRPRLYPASLYEAQLAARLGE